MRGTAKIVELPRRVAEAAAKAEQVLNQRRHDVKRMNKNATTTASNWRDPWIKRTVKADLLSPSSLRTCPAIEKPPPGQRLMAVET